MASSTVSKNFFLLIVLLVTIAFFGLMSQFIIVLFWATILSILFSNRFEKIKAGMPQKPNLAAALTLGYVFIIVVIPLVLFSLAVVNEARVIVAGINKGDISIQDQVQNLQNDIPRDNKTLLNFGITAEQIETRIAEFKTNATQSIAGYVVGITKGVFRFFFHFFLIFYVLFFFLRDGKKMLDELIKVIPIDDQIERELLNRFESVARATVKGNLTVAILNGVAIGLLFWIFGIRAALIWGVVVIAVALLPAGSIFVLVPWSIVLMMNGNVIRGLALLVTGSVIIALIDNILRPLLVGKDAKLPNYLVLLSTLGGLAWFGISGFVIGPVIAAFFVTCWQMMGKEYGTPN